MRTASLPVAFRGSGLACGRASLFWKCRVPNRSASRPHFCAEDESGQVASLPAAEDDRIHKATSGARSKVWQYEMRMERSLSFATTNTSGSCLQGVARRTTSWPFARSHGWHGISFADTEDLLCLLVVWGIVRWERGKRGLLYGLSDASALDELETQGAERFRWKNYS